MRTSLYAFIFTLIFTLAAQAESWKIATLEWPPYVCSQCYRNGAAADALRTVLKKKGITVEFVFYPWIQAQKMGARRAFAGYFPAWKEEILPGFMPSTALFSSPVVLMERKDQPLVWTNLEDLKGKTFGVTAGYGNTIEFNRLIQNGTLKTVQVISEESVIRRLIAGSIDGVLIDLFVGNYYLKNLFSLQQDKIAVGSKVIENKDLYFAFNEASLQKADVLNSALQSTDFRKSVADYLNKKNPKKISKN